MTGVVDAVIRLPGRRKSGNRTVDRGCREEGHCADHRKTTVVELRLALDRKRRLRDTARETDRIPTTKQGDKPRCEPLLGRGRAQRSIRTPVVCCPSLSFPRSLGGTCQETNDSPDLPAEARAAARHVWRRL